METDRKRTLFQSLRLRILASLGLTAAVLLSWWLRIEDARAPDELPAVTFGQPVLAGRTSLLPEALRVQDGQLVLEATLENITGSTLDAPFGAPPRLPELVLDASAVPASEVVLVRDGETLQQLHPRMPERVKLVWPYQDANPAQSVTIRFQRQTFKLEDNLYGQAHWLGHEPSGELHATPEVAP